MSTGPKKGYNLETIVHKATSSKIEPPKRKHVRNIILQTHNEHGASGFYHELFKRPLERDDVTTYKALVTVHSVLHEGHPKVMEDSYYRVTFLESLKNNWKLRGTESAELIVMYIDFILSKIMFHHNYPEFQGDFSIEAYLRKKPVFSAEKSLQIVGHIQDLQHAIHILERKIFSGSRGVSECKASALIPLVLESFGLYQMAVHLIKNLVNEVDSMDVLSVLIERFYGQFITLKTFYSDTAGIKYVTSIIAVPTLPKDPPVFKETKTSTPRLRKRETRSPAPVRKAPEPIPEPKPEPAPQANLNWNPFTGTATQQQTWVTFGTEAPIAPQPVFQPQPVYQPPAPQPVYQQPVQTYIQPVQQIAPQPVQQPKVTATQGGFGDLLTMVSAMKVPEEEKRKREEEKKRKEDLIKYEEDLKRKNEEARIRAEREREDKRRIQLQEDERRRKQAEEEQRQQKHKQELELKKQEEEKRLAAREAELVQRERERFAQEQERIKKIVQEETSEELRKLKLRILELETELERERDKNKDLTKELDVLRKRLEVSEREQEALIVAKQGAEMKEAIITSLNSENQRLQMETEQLRAQVATIQQTNNDENDRLLVRELENARDSVELGLSRLDNPTNLGNDAATAHEVNEDAAALMAAGERLLHACTVGAREELYESISTIVKQSAMFFDDVKGASRKVFDNDARQKLLDSARAAGDAIANLLSVANNIGGRITDDESMKETVDSTNEMKERLTEVQAAATNAEKSNEQPEEEGGEDLEDLAEKELLAAARAIEKAAEVLLSAQSNRPQVALGVPDVAGAIFDAAMAITKATAMLVNAAAVAQKERVEKGKIFSGALYKRDPTWSQGLISSAKSVAAATQTLITSANDAIHGKVEEEQVVAASKGVASATAHLIAATRAKSDDPNGATQQKLNMASRAIAAAVAQLVAAAKAAAKPEQEVVFDASTSETARKIKEMEIQTQILKLEKELQLQRTGLGNLRKQSYENK